jgi:hypothetical protein
MSHGHIVEVEAQSKLPRLARGHRWSAQLSGDIRAVDIGSPTRSRRLARVCMSPFSLPHFQVTDAAFALVATIERSHPLLEAPWKSFEAQEIILGHG